MTSKARTRWHQEAWRFATRGIWEIEIGSLSAARRLGVHTLRMLHLVARGFFRDECPLHASALTFSSLVALVPMLALSLALARGLGGGDAAKQWIRDGVEGWTRGFHAAEAAAGSGVAREITPDDLAMAIQNLLEHAFEKVENVSFAALGGVGLLVLLWMAIDVLARVEYAFNRVWGVSAGRTLWRRTTDYLTVILVAPFLVMAASSWPVADLITRHLNPSAAGAVQTFLGSGFFKALTAALVLSLAMTFLLMFMPNTRVQMLPGVAGGVTAALLFLGWLWFCAILQVGVARYGKIYGSFAVFPIILAWVHVSWQIVLFGAEVAFAAQNSGSYQVEQGAGRANARARVLLALAVCVECGRALGRGDPGFDPAAFARARRVSVRLLNDVIADLAQAGLLAELSGEPRRYVLLRAPGSLGVSDVVDCMLRAGVHPESLGLTPGRIEPAVRQAAEAALDAANQALKRRTIQELAGPA